VALQGYNARGLPSIQAALSLRSTLGDPADMAVAKLHIYAGHWHSHLCADGCGACKVLEMPGPYLHLGSPGGCWLIPRRIC